MKKALLIIVATGATIATIIGCTKDKKNTTVDKCATVTCQNGGTCYDGSCLCSSGYSGTYCEIH